MGRSASSQSVPSIVALGQLRVSTIHARLGKCFLPYDVNSEKLFKIITYIKKTTMIGLFKTDIFKIFKLQVFYFYFEFLFSILF